jgi:hypothetical protein
VSLSHATGPDSFINTIDTLPRLTDFGLADSANTESNTAIAGPIGVVRWSASDKTHEHRTRNSVEVRLIGVSLRATTLVT